MANFSYSVLQSTLLHLDKVEQGFTQEITTTEPFCRQKNYHKNRHILPTGQWYAPSAVINDALIMQWIVQCRVQCIVECIVKCKVYCILHCIEQYIVYSSVAHSSKSCWNISQLMPKCSPCSFHVETTSPCGRRNLHVEHNLATWKQLLHVENDFSIWKTTSPCERWPLHVEDNLFMWKKTSPCERQPLLLEDDLSI